MLLISPMMTVVVLAVLWLIVVVPMLVKHKDDRAGERSAARFGSAMRALSTRRSLGALARPVSQDEYDEPAPAVASHSQVFVPGGATSVPAARRPIPAAMEAVMYPDRVPKTELSEARRQMMARRRRSLAILVAGTVLGLLWGMVAGTTMATVVGLLFAAGLGGYLLFLRNQARRDRERRQARLQRSGVRVSHDYDATAELDDTISDTVVRIDDEDVELRGMADTIDLTGLYVEEEFDERPMRRAV